MPHPSDPGRQRAAAALAEFWAESGAITQDESDALVAMAAPKSTSAGAGRPAAASGPATGTGPQPSRRRQVNPIALAREAAAKAQNLPDLKAAIEGFEHCPLKVAARNTVVCDGAMDADVMLIGEAPGAEEDARGLPFVGRSGKLLDRMLASIGLFRASNIYITNLIYWRPPGNRDPAPDEVAVCAPFLARQIELKRPKLLLAAGKPATQYLLKTDDGIMRTRGRRMSYVQDGLSPIPCIPMLHPSYLLRRPPEKAKAWSDLLAVAALCDELGIKRPDAP